MSGRTSYCLSDADICVTTSISVSIRTILILYDILKTNNIDQINEKYYLSIR